MCELGIMILSNHSEIHMVKKDHPGFKAVQGKIEKEGYSKQAAGAILANASRNASSAAKKSNPALKKVSGPVKRGK